MAKERLSLQYTQAYFQDRVRELRNQVPNGDPFVFIGALSVLSSVLDMAELDFELPTEYGPFVTMVLRDISDNLSLFYARYMDPPEDTVSEKAPGHKIGFSHDDSLHLKVVQSEDKTLRKTVISANKFLDSVSEVIDKVFDHAANNEILACRLFANVNDRRLFGHGK